MKSEYRYCKHTGKFCYSSEAKAVRAVNKHYNLRRVYYCEHCESYHTTKIGVSLALREGIIEEADVRKTVSPEDIQKRMEKLIEREEKRNDSKN